MAEPIKIHTPFTEEMSKKFHIGDAVLITGEIYAARDAAHKKMCEALAKGEKLPIDWHDKMVYYLGPTPAKPKDFSGGVGKFNISAQLAKTEVRAGDPINLRLVLSGTGNLKLVKEPAVQIPSDFDKYDTKITDKTKLSEAGVEGNMIYDYLFSQFRM